MKSNHSTNYHSHLKEKQLIHITGGSTLRVNFDLNVIKEKLLEEIRKKRLEQQSPDSNAQDNNIPVIPS